MTTITITGRATADPELRFNQSGQAVANLNVAVNHRRFNKQTNEWEDDGADFYAVAAWRHLAENVAESITKGVEVIVVGTLKSRSYDDRDGNKRTVWEITADHIGPSLRYATAQVTRASSSGGGGAQQARPQQSSPARQQADDPWARTPTLTDEPPF